MKARKICVSLSLYVYFIHNKIEQIISFYRTNVENFGNFNFTRVSSLIFSPLFCYNNRDKIYERISWKIYLFIETKINLLYSQ